MNKELESRWQQLEQAQREFLAALEGWDKELLSWQPADCWSAAQVVEHLITAETGTLGYMKKKSSSGWDTLEQTGDEHIASSRAINARLASDEQYKAPSVLPEPTNGFPVDGMLKHWQNLRSDIQAFVSTVEPVHFNKLVFRQPNAGMLNVLQAIEFMSHHVRHHIPQLERIKAASGQ